MPSWRECGGYNTPRGERSPPDVSGFLAPAARGASWQPPKKRDTTMTKQSLNTLSSLLRASYRTMICERPEDSHLTEISFLVHSDDVAAILKQMVGRVAS